MIDAATAAKMAISAEMSALMTEYLGRGPAETETAIIDDLVVCSMHDTMTKAERSVAGKGDDRLFAPLRRTDAFAKAAVAIVERVTGRHAVSFMSGHDLVDDTVVHVFVMDQVDKAQPANSPG